MAASFENINFSLRPAKCIERKMLVDALRRLQAFEDVSRYRYVGLGARYFADFALFHRALGVRDMVSIERETRARRRFEFNRPFRTVTLKFGATTAILPSLQWTRRSIVWLDYDDPLNSDMLADVRTVAGNAVSGSALIVTVNAQPEKVDSDRLGVLRTRVGTDRIPADISAADLTPAMLGATYRKVVVNEIAETLVARNGGAGSADRVRYEQLFNFSYQDGARMRTVGGVIVGAAEADALQRCRFEELEFVRRGFEAYDINVPKLTHRELRFLDTHLPQATGSSLNQHDIPINEAEHYARLYRYFPTFAEADI